MLTLTITTSAGIKEYILDVPVNDKIALHYDECNYCDKIPVRRESIHLATRPDSHRFCSGYHRKVFSAKGLTHMTA